MDELRSSSNGDGRMEADGYGSRIAPSSFSDPHDLRCYSTSHVPSSSFSNTTIAVPRDMKLKKWKSTSGSSSSSSSSSSSKVGWSLSDPELQRKKRVAGYKAFALEGKMKGSFRKSFRWIKDRCSQVVYGRW